MRTVLSRGRMVGRYLNVGMIKEKHAFVFSSGSCQQVAGSAGSLSGPWLPFFTFVVHSRTMHFKISDSKTISIRCTDFSSTLLCLQSPSVPVLSQNLFRRTHKFRKLAPWESDALSPFLYDYARNQI